MTDTPPIVPPVNLETVEGFRAVKRHCQSVLNVIAAVEAVGDVERTRVEAETRLGNVRHEEAQLRASVEDLKTSVTLYEKKESALHQQAQADSAAALEAANTQAASIVAEANKQAAAIVQAAQARASDAAAAAQRELDGYAKATAEARDALVAVSSELEGKRADLKEADKALQKIKAQAGKLLED